MENLDPPSPPNHFPKSRMGKWRVVALRAASSLIWGGWGFAVPFYFVQDRSLLELVACWRNGCFRRLTHLQGLLVTGKRMRLKWKVAVASVPFQKFAIMRLHRLHMLILFLFLPNRNAFASINKRIVLAQPTVILVSYDGFRWDYMEKVDGWQFSTGVEGGWVFVTQLTSQRCPSTLW